MGKVLSLERPRKGQNEPRVGIIIQARMTSKRFPGKSMALLQGVPVITHVINRCLQVKPKRMIYVAVPDTPESEPLLEWIHQNYHKNYVDNACGPEDNVLERYYGAALHFGLDHIVRITGDCPFINPKVVSEVIELHLNNKYDYTSNVYPERSFPQGFDCEVFTMDCLEWAYKEWQEISKKKVKNIRDNAYAQGADYCMEHVTPLMQHTPGINRGNLVQKKNDSAINLCVDTPEDIERLEKMFSSNLKVIK